MSAEHGLLGKCGQQARHLEVKLEPITRRSQPFPPETSAERSHLPHERCDICTLEAANAVHAVQGGIAPSQAQGGLRRVDACNTTFTVN